MVYNADKIIGFCDIGSQIVDIGVALSGEHFCSVAICVELLLVLLEPMYCRTLLYHLIFNNKTVFYQPDLTRRFLI